MSNDGVLYAFTDTSCIIKLVGAIKYTTIATDFERFIDGLIERDEVQDVVIDMRECTYIDSTDLGILARITVSQMKKGFGVPVLLYKVGSEIDSILHDVGFSRVFKMMQHHEFDETALQKLEKEAAPDQLKMAKMMLEAHKLLIELDDGNREKFSTVVDYMEQSVDSLSEKREEQ